MKSSMTFKTNFLLSIFSLFISLSFFSCSQKTEQHESIQVDSEQVTTDQENIEQEAPSIFDFTYKKLTGKIGNTSIVMYLLKDSSSLSGSYTTLKDGIPLLLEGEINEDGTFKLEHVNRYNQPAVEFKGKLTEGVTISGTWKDLLTDKSAAFSLKEATDNPISLSIVNRKKENCSNVKSNQKERCTSITLNYFQVATSSPDITEKINQTIVKAICNVDFGALHFSSIDQLMNSINTPKAGQEEGYEREISTALLANDPTILSIAVHQHYYRYYVQDADDDEFYYNFNLQTGNLISLDELLVPNYTVALNQIGQEIFLQAYDPEDWDFETTKFELNRNFTITPTGLLFLFNRYELNPDVMSKLPVFIPYSKINHLIKPKGILEVWRKK